MDFLKKVSEGAKSLGEGAKSIGKRSSDLVEATKLKLEISKREKEVANNLAALGHLVYLQFKGEKGHEEEIQRLLNTTKELEEEIANIVDQVEKLNPKPPACPKCNTELPPIAKYCMICGEKLPEEQS